MPFNTKTVPFEAWKKLSSTDRITFTNVRDYNREV